MPPGGDPVPTIERMKPMAGVKAAPLLEKLKTNPTKADTLFNLSIVKWQGKKVGPGAVAAWKKLLETNSAYPDKETVLQLMAQQRCCSLAFPADPRSLPVRSDGRHTSERPRE